MASRVVALLIFSALAFLSLGARINKRRKWQSTRDVAGVLVHEHSVGAMAAAETVEAWTIVMKPGSTNAQIGELCRGRCSMVGHPSDGGVPFAEFHGSEMSLTELLSGHADEVAFVEPEVLENALPEDTRASTPAASLPSWGLERVGVPQRKTHGRGVHIYMLDTGVMATHSDFEGRVIPTLDTTQGRAQECKGNTLCAGDKNGHGTHTAGTAAGKTYGVADAATIHAIKCVGDNGRGFRSWVTLAIDWVATKAEHPAVASVSLQYNGESWSMERAVAAATRAGIAVVVAAGNVNSWSCDFSPGYVPEAITVGATTPADAKAQWSNFGSCNNIWAPGADITSAFIGGNSASETWSGTSMAAPHVSGAAALLLEKNPSMTRDQIMARLKGDGLKGVVSGIKPNDPDLLLWVGSD